MTYVTILLLLCFGPPAFAGKNSDLLHTIKSPGGKVMIWLHRLRISQDGENRTTYFYVVRKSLADDLIYLPSQLESSLDGERTDFSKHITLHWSPSESAFVLQENFPADAPCGRLHIVGPIRESSSWDAIPFETRIPTKVANEMKKHPERFHPYAPIKVLRVTDTEVTLDFTYYKNTYRYADRGVPK